MPVGKGNNSLKPIDKPVTNNGNSTIRLEAEDGDNIINYRLENNGAASGNKTLSFVGQGKNETGSVTFDFNGTADSYKLIVGTFDESDGLAAFKFENDVWFLKYSLLA